MRSTVLDWRRLQEDYDYAYKYMDFGSGRAVWVAVLEGQQGLIAAFSAIKGNAQIGTDLELDVRESGQRVFPGYAALVWPVS
jgi:hypothetical protein